MRPTIVAALCLAMLSAPLWAKLPPLTDAQKADAAAKAAKAAEGAKKEAEALTKVQNMVVERYKKGEDARGKGAVRPAMAAPAAKKK